MSRTIKIDKQGVGVAYTGAWTGLAGGNETQLEDAKNLGYASGTFGDNIGAGLALANGVGVGKTNLKSGIDFTYNSKLNAVGGSDVDIYDDNASGAFTGGHYMRIVNNAKNITDVTGLNIQNVYAKSLGGNTAALPSPTSTDVHIDPELGRFILPRPLYWSRQENLVSMIITPSLYLNSMTSAFSSYVYGGSTGEDFPGGIFGNCYRFSGSAGYGGGGYVDWNAYRDIYIHGATTRNWSKGTISQWLYLYPVVYWDGHPDKNMTSTVRAYFLNLPAAGNVCFYAEASHNLWGGITVQHVFLNINGANVASAVFSYNVWHHLYIAWDQAKGLSGSNSVLIYVDGALVLASNATLPNIESTTFLVKYQCDGWGNSYPDGVSVSWDMRADNLKIWDHVASDTAAWEYNGGSGREDALHYIYGAGNGYKPQITGTNNGVGYYYLSLSTTPATSGGSGGDETETLKASTTTNAAGSFGDSGVLCDNSFNALNTTSHYNYEKRMDASTVEDPVYGFGTVAGGIIDTSPSGALAVGTYVRLVDKTLNIKDANYPSAAYGGLKIFAKSLGGTDRSIWPCPSKDRMYVDPMTGNYCFPRPTYWSKCETIANITTTPEIGTGAILSYTGAPAEGLLAPGKFGNCYSAAATAYSQWFFSTFTTNIQSTKGTISAWLTHKIVAVGDISFVVFYIGSTAAVYSQYYGGSLPNTTVIFYPDGTYGSSGIIPHYTWYHLYIVWDESNGLSGGKCIRIFVNGTERLSSISSIIFSNSVLSFRLGEYAVDWSGTGIDNLKIWNEIVSEDPSWEYNAGAGREDAMHEIYGGNYKPDLAAGSCGVGYYRGGASTRQCVITV